MSKRERDNNKTMASNYIDAFVSFREEAAHVHDDVQDLCQKYMDYVNTLTDPINRRDYTSAVNKITARARELADDGRIDDLQDMHAYLEDNVKYVEEESPQQWNDMTAKGGQPGELHGALMRISFGVFPG